MDIFEKAIDYVDRNFEKMVGELADICGYPSVAGNREGLEGARRAVYTKMEELGLNPVIHPVEGGNALISAECSGEHSDTVLFYNHYDVVEPGKPELWKNGAPFKTCIEDGRIYARGISDDKGPLYSRLHAVQAIMAVNGGRLPATVKFLVEGDEETSSPSMTRFSREQREAFADLTRADVCIWENGRKDENGHPWLRMGVRGNCSFDLHVKTADTDVHGRMGATVPSASWRLVWALASLKGMDERIRIPGFYDEIVPPTESDFQVLRDFPYDEEAQKQRLGIGNFVLNLEGEELKRKIYLEPSVSICGLEAGEVHNGVRGIVPHKAYARISFYLVADQDPVRIGRLLREHLDRNGFDDIEIVSNEAASNRPVRTPVDHPIRKRVCQAAERVYEKPMVVELTQLGAGPACILRDVWPDLPIIGIGPGNTCANHHAPNENMKLLDYKEAIGHMIALLLSYGN